jgi:hypothetical protein
MESIFKTLRTHTTSLENRLAASSARETPKARLVYAGAVACLIAQGCSTLYTESVLQHVLTK